MGALADVSDTDSGIPADASCSICRVRSQSAISGIVAAARSYACAAETASPRAESTVPR